MKKISIIGCGWLGKDLFKTLNSYFKVECLSRTDIKDESSFYLADIIIISINTKDNYLQTLEKIARLTKESSTIILMSSTSVYKEFDKEVNEDILIRDIKLQRQAELLLMSLRDNVLILRLGGLMGEDRISGKWKNVSRFSDGEVNYIHKEDVINISKKLIESDIRKGIYNLVAPMHPLRSEIHKKNCKKFALKLGTFEGRTKRVVLSDKIIKDLDYKFIYPNPLEFWD